MENFCYALILALMGAFLTGYIVMKVGDYLAERFGDHRQSTPREILGAKKAV